MIEKLYRFLFLVIKFFIIYLITGIENARVFISRLDVEATLVFIATLMFANMSSNLTIYK